MSDKYNIEVREDSQLCKALRDAGRRRSDDAFYVAQGEFARGGSKFEPSMAPETREIAVLLRATALLSNLQIKPETERKDCHQEESGAFISGVFIGILVGCFLMAFLRFLL